MDAIFTSGTKKHYTEFICGRTMAKISKDVELWWSEKDCKVWLYRAIPFKGSELIVLYNASTLPDSGNGTMTISHYTTTLMKIETDKVEKISSCREFKDKDFFISGSTKFLREFESLLFFKASEYFSKEICQYFSECSYIS